MSKLELGECLALGFQHVGQHFKVKNCENWRSECERKGHIYWNHGDPEREGNKCLDCGATKS